MAKNPNTVVEVEDWPGLVLSADPRDLPEGGAEEQTNACSLNFGQLTIRKGMRLVSFEET